MSINKIISLTIVASFYVFGLVESTDSDNFTLNKFLGRWYEIATISHSDATISCEWFEVTRGDNGNGSFNEVYSTTYDKRDVRLFAHGNVINSELHVTYTLKEESTDMVYTIESYNDGKELLLIEKEGRQDDQLISRSATASANATAQCERLAKAKGKRFVYVQHSNCSHHEN